MTKMGFKLVTSATTIKNHLLAYLTLINDQLLQLLLPIMTIMSCVGRLIRKVRQILQLSHRPTDMKFNQLLIDDSPKTKHLVSVFCDDDNSLFAIFGYFDFGSGVPKVRRVYSENTLTLRQHAFCL